MESERDRTENAARPIQQLMVAGAVVDAGDA